MRHAGWAGAAILISTLLAPTLGVAVEYTVTTVPGGQCRLHEEVCDFLHDVNDVGQTLVENAVVVPGDHIESYALNNVGDIVGFYLQCNCGFIKSGGVITKFAVPGASFTTASRINNRGDIVGFSRSGSKYRSFVRAPDGTFTTFEFPGADGTFASGINDSGHIVGTYRQGTTSKSFLKQGEIIRILTTPAPNCEAEDINDLGQILGNCLELKPGNLVPTSVRVFVKHGTAADAPVDLLVFGTYETSGGGINNAGQIVGGHASIGGPSSNYIATPRLGSTAVAAAVLPSSRAVQVGTTATAFATMLATGPEAAVDCSIAPTNAPPGTAFQYQQTNVADVPIGQPNTPATIPGSGAQSFIIRLTPSQVFPATDIQFIFRCSNTSPVAVLQGVNTLLLTAASAPTPDIVALVATPTNDGVTNIPGPTGTGFFSVATVNVGAGAAITATVDTGSATLPVVLSLCQTNSSTGACVNPATPGSRATVQIDANQTPTFAIFVQGTGNVSFSPGVNRVFVRFTTQTRGIVGATSVAVRTQ